MTWGSYIKNAVLALLFLGGVVGIVVHSVNLYLEGKMAHRLAVVSGGWCTALTLFASFRLILQHLNHFVSVRQRYVVRILAMIPIYSVESYLALCYRHRSAQTSLCIETLRESYEAFAVYSFLYFLLALIGSEKDLNSLLKSRPTTPLVVTKIGVLQYVAVKVFLAIFLFVLISLDLISDSDDGFSGIRLVINILSSVSQVIALGSLGSFYWELQEHLAPWRPLAKFALVKSVVFATWFQALIVTYLAHNTSLLIKLKGHSPWTQNEFAHGIQDYSICVEMLVASVASTFVFPANEFRATVPGSRDSSLEQNDRAVHADDDDGSDSMAGEKKPFLTAFFQSSIPTDMIYEFRQTLFERAKSSSPARLVEKRSIENSSGMD